MVNLDALAASWRSLFHGADMPPPPRVHAPRREAIPAIPFEPRAVARIQLVRRVVAVPRPEAS